MGGLAAGLLGLLLSPLLVRVSGTALIMLTLAFSQLAYVSCLKYREVTFGEDGVAGYPIPPFNIPFVASFDMLDPTNFYYFAIAVIVVCIWVMWFLTKTPFGSLMSGIRDNQARVAYMGFNLPTTKAIVFTLAGFFAGIAGSLFALFQNVVSADGVLHILVSFLPLMSILVGGVGTFFGPILGAGILLLVEELSLEFTEHVELISGLVFVVIVLYAPTGLIGIYRKIELKWLLRDSKLATTQEVS
jgi:branched-chain amino acid transport system permease protein